MEKGFWEILFQDWRFRHFLLPRVAGGLYAVGLSLGFLYALFWVMGAMGVGGAWGFLALLLAPGAFLLYALGLRVLLEVGVAAVRAAERLEEAGRGGGP